MKKLAFFLSNRCSYERAKVLIEKLDNEFDLTLYITSGLLEDSNLTQEIHDKYTAIELEVNGIDGTLSGMVTFSHRLMRHIQDCLERNRPDGMILWADRFELLPVATVCNYLQIPIYHIQGGEESGNVDNCVRNAVSMLSQYHFVSHYQAEQKLKQYGLSNVFTTGCPSIDVIRSYGIKPNNTPGQYIIGMFHPHSFELAECKEQTLKVYQETARYCYNNGLKLHWFGPNNDPGSLDVKSSLLDVQVVHNMPSRAFLTLLSGALCIVGNTSSCIREASYLGVPAVIVGNRQVGRVKSLNAVESTFDNIYDTIASQTKIKNYYISSTLFGNGHASERIVNIIKELL
jgi:UDP-hydrolysing UDP-N-acetyl-D-glucosamine 2-epimerase